MIVRAENAEKQQPPTAVLNDYGRFLLTFLAVIISLLGLIVDVIRLTIEVAEKFPQRNNDDNKKD